MKTQLFVMVTTLLLIFTKAEAQTGGASSTAWQSFTFASQAQTFTAVFDAVSHQNRMDGVTGLGLGPADAYSDLGVIVRFNPAGFLDARNGSAYQATQAIPYTAGTRYRVRLVVNVPQHTYSASVTPEGRTEQTLATNFAFRTEQRTVPQLDTWALHVERGSHTVSNFTLGASSSTAWQNFTFASQAQTFTAVFDAVPHQNRMDGVTGLGLGPADAYSDLGVIVRFNPAGFLDARNGSAYQATQAIPYTAGTRYRVRLVVNVPQHTYSASVTPEGRTEQTLATNFAFRTEQRTVPQLDTWALHVESGSHTVSNFSLVIIPPCPALIAKEKSLMIRVPSVVDDEDRTVWTGATTTASDGAWSFGRLMANMAGDENDPADFVQRWLDHWEADRVVNGFTVAARPRIKSLVLDPWLELSNGPLDLTKAPMRLLAIVYRPDLRDLAKGKGGEGRFVFGVLDRNQSPLPFTVILEYNLPATTTDQVTDWAVKFQRLSTLPDGELFNAELEEITQLFAGKNVAPTRINGSAISQVRTNEIALSDSFPPLWELREFRLNASDKFLQEVTVNKTPELGFNGTDTLARWIDKNASDILKKGQVGFEVPMSFEGQPFLAGAIVNNQDVWNATTKPENRQAMFLVAINTCNGCHGRETATPLFVHIDPQRQDSDGALLSTFLSGSNTNGVDDPRDGEPVRQFNELEFRVQDMTAMLCRAAGSGITARRAIPEPADPFGRTVTGDLRRGPSVGLAH